MKRISLVMPYYDNPGMLDIHYTVLRGMPDRLKQRVEVVIVDDGSPTTAAAEVKRPEGLPYLKIFRVMVDLPWHQHAARNIGAREARGPWLFLTDMDHLIPLDTWDYMLGLSDQTNPRHVFVPRRFEADTGRPKIDPRNGREHPHPNTFLINREFFWQVGGYDEDYCGIYGTDGLFRKRLWAVATRIPMQKCILRYDREVQADASTTTLPRKEGRDPDAKRRIDERKRAEGTFGKPATLKMSYKLVHRFDPYRIEK